MKKLQTKFTLKVKLLCMSLLPTILLGTVLLIFFVQSIKNGMEQETLNGVQAVAGSFIAALDDKDSGDFTQDQTGKVAKGRYVITGSYAMEDKIKNETGYDVTVFYGDTRVATSIKDASSGQRIIGTQAADEVKNAVLKNGEKYISKSVSIDGQNYFCCYIPLKNSDGSVVGMVVAGAGSNRVEGYINTQIALMCLIAGIAAALVLIISIVIPAMITKEIRKEAESIRTLSMGDLSAEIDQKLLNKKDELGEIANELLSLKKQLHTTVNEIKSSSRILSEEGTELSDMSDHTSATAHDISTAVEEVAKGAVAQADEISKASGNVDTMSEAINDIVRDVRKFDEVSEQMKISSEESARIINQLVESNERTRGAMNRIAEQVNATDSSVQNIGEAIKIITSIAEETNLLSLNASIEAARAGDAGRGFAVVATQIQKLAEQSNTSADDIRKTIEELQKQSGTSIEVMEQVKKAVEEQQTRLDQTKEKVIDVSDGVGKVHGMAVKIKEDTDICTASKSVVADAISNLAAISQENAASSEETNASMEELNATISLLAESARKLKTISLNLETDVSFFQLA